MNEDHRRPSPLRGLWSLSVGGLLLAVLLVALDPVTRFEDCPNYGASGNASAFTNPAWDLLLPLLAFGWITATIVEQVFPFARRGRADSIVRAAAAIGISTIVSCCGVGGLLGMCH